jgi:Ca2+-binding EF-hand superfamily protein
MALSTGSRFKIHSRGEFRSVEEDETA